MSLSFTNSLKKKSELNYHKHNKRVGILGGTFDPIHLGHMIAAESVRSQLHLDEVWFMPTYISPHKQQQNITSSEHRVTMLEHAIRPYPEFRICLHEIEKGLVSYTYNTVQSLLTQYMDHQFFFIIGGDMVHSLPQWYRYEELVQMVTFVAIERPSYPLDSSMSWAQSLLFVEMPQVMISSTDIRERCKEGRSIRFLVPDAVELYIKEQQLYVG